VKIEAHDEFVVHDGATTGRELVIKSLANEIVMRDVNESTRAMDHLPSITEEEIRLHNASMQAALAELSLVDIQRLAVKALEIAFFAARYDGDPSANIVVPVRRSYIEGIKEITDSRAFIKRSLEFKKAMTAETAPEESS
jgi:hypothetical protein